MGDELSVGTPGSTPASTPGSAGSPKVYKHSGGSSDSYNVPLLSALLDIKVPSLEFEFHNDKQRSPYFLFINPRGEIPTLVDGALTLTESADIIAYLAGKLGA